MKLPNALLSLASFGAIVMLPVVQSTMLIVGTICLVGYQSGRWAGDGGNVPSAIYIALLVAYLIKTFIGLPRELEEIKETPNNGPKDLPTDG